MGKFRKLDFLFLDRAGMAHSVASQTFTVLHTGSPDSVPPMFLHLRSAKYTDKNKIVLLRERKRHTARRVAVASACYSGEGGYPEYPPRPGMGPPPGLWMGYPPYLGWGTPLPYLDLGWGNPPT